MANIQSFKGLNPSKRSFFSWRDRSAPAGGWQVFICRRFSLSGSNAPAGGCRTVVCCRLSLSGSNAPAGDWQVFICRRFSLSGSNAPAGGCRTVVCCRLSLSGSNAPAGGCRTVVCCRLSLAPRWRPVFVDGTCRMAYSFCFVPKFFGAIPKGLHRRRLECLVVGGEGSHPWPTPHFQIANTPQRDKCFINNILQNGSV